MPSARRTLLSVVSFSLYVCGIIVLLAGVSATTASAQDFSPLARLETLGLDTMKVGRVTAYSAPTDREFAHQLAALSEVAAAYFELELGASFPLHLAVLSPDDWTALSADASSPYGMPWGSVEDLLMVAPASLDEGVLIRGSDREANRRRVQFVLLHEFGHLANKRHLHPESARPYSAVWWFEEFLATYFAYAYIRGHEPEWAEASRSEWREVVKGYTPAVFSLDWGFMHDLPPKEFVRTYGWYQNLLNLQVANIYDKYGLDFLRAVRERLSWESSGEWTNESLLRSLEEIAPGFEAWADELDRGDYLHYIED